MSSLYAVVIAHAVPGEGVVESKLRSPHPSLVPFGVFGMPE
jgi:hypothetical protein